MGVRLEVDMTKKGILVSVSSLLLAMALTASPAHAQASPGAQPVAQEPSNTTMMRSVAVASVLATIRKVAKCALGIAGFAAANYIAVYKLRKAGGVWKVAKETWRAKGKIGKVKVLAAVFGELTGLNAVAEGCGI
jgi:hypothetical protein